MGSDQWQLTAIEPAGAVLELGLYPLPHLAAQAVAEQKTGLELWDTAALPPGVKLAALHDLKRWSRHELTPPEAR